MLFFTLMCGGSMKVLVLVNAFIDPNGKCKRAPYCILATCDRMGGRKFENTVVMVRRKYVKNSIGFWSEIPNEKCSFYVNEIFSRVELHGFVREKSLIDGIRSLFPVAPWSVTFNGFRIYIFPCSTAGDQLLHSVPLSTHSAAATATEREIRHQKRQIYGLTVNNLYFSRRVNKPGLHKPNRCQSRFHKKILKSYDR